MWRCLDCVGMPKFCWACCQSSHKNDPFHCIESWTGSYYTCASLRSLGVSNILGHGSETCPAIAHPGRFQHHHPWPKVPTTVIMVVVDTTGIHELLFAFCVFAGAEAADIQLLEMGFYPATPVQPRTVVTFRALDDILLTNKECKTSIMNYYNRLCRLTNDTFPHTVPDWYRDLLRVAHQWQNLKACKFHGIGYNNRLAPTAGQLAIACPTCPRPGINMPDNWQADPESYIHDVSVIMDGNFGAKHQHMKHLEDDVCLANGHCFRVTDKPYKAHLQTAVQLKQKLNCHEHQAVLAAGSDQGALEAMGISATACSRHGFFVPHCVVDFQKGEQRKNMDYSLYQMMVFLYGITTMLVLYDIWCFYRVHLQSCFRDSLAISLPDGLELLGGIDQFHVHDHHKECYARYSPNFIPGVGVQQTDVIELLWGNTNDIANSTRGQGTGSCQENVDNIMNDSNWNKLIRHSKRNTEVIDDLPVATDALPDITPKENAGKVKEWSDMAATPAAEHWTNPAAMDIYEVQTSKLPTRVQIQLDLTHSENLNADNCQLKGAASWISFGLRIEEQSDEPRTVEEAMENDDYVAEEDFEDAEAATAAALSTSGSTSLGAAALRAPAEPTAAGSGSAPPAQPEQLNIALPLCLGMQFCERHKLMGLVQMEHQLRTGQMNDALHRVWVSIRYKSLLYRTSVRKAKSNRKKLRSFDEVHLANSDVLEGARVYTDARCNKEEGIKLKELLATHQDLKKKELWANTALIEHAVRGASKESVLWFWGLEIDHTLKASGWLVEMAWVMWLHAHAHMSRLREEIKILQEEMERTRWMFKYERQLWEDRTGGRHAAWAAQQATLWETLCTHADAEFRDTQACYKVSRIFL
ncbi:hypothetical protein C8Q74DRAFT_1212211 [Fomes fomentarius]|nr:hypothetical protein C8Q74DRAFT_1212211 [Fomes fomentarius]